MLCRKLLKGPLMRLTPLLVGCYRLSTPRILNQLRVFDKPPRQRLVAAAGAAACRDIRSQRLVLPG